MGAFPSDPTLSMLLIGYTRNFCLLSYVCPTTSLKAFIKPKSFRQGLLHMENHVVYDGDHFTSSSLLSFLPSYLILPWLRF